MCVRERERDTVWMYIHKSNTCSQTVTPNVKQKYVAELEERFACFTHAILLIKTLNNFTYLYGLRY